MICSSCEYEEACGGDWDEEGMDCPLFSGKPNYIYILERDGQTVDQTTLDEPDEDLASSLFYGEFDWAPEKGDRVLLVDVRIEGTDGAVWG